VGQAHKQEAAGRRQGKHQAAKQEATGWVGVTTGQAVGHRVGQATGHAGQATASSGAGEQTSCFSALAGAVERECETRRRGDDAY
jgi:hypothetical protein